MAFRNSVKATLLFEEEQPRSRSDDPPPIFAPPAESAPLAHVAPPPAADDASLGATWHKRAEELCAMADTLPCKSSWSLISKIAGLYDELARDAGWTEPEDLPPAALRPEDEPDAADEPPAPAPLADPPPPERMSFPRRPLPLGRAFPRRRA